MAQERVTERLRERTTEPLTVYDLIAAELNKQKENCLNGKVVLRGDELPWEQNRQGRIRFYCHNANWHTLAAPGWLSFIHDIRKHSGKHRHQGGTSLFVLEGTGYTVVNGRRFDWEAGDMILLPVQAGGCEHQHFNLSEDGSAKWLSLIFQWVKQAMANEVVQQEVSPDWNGLPAEREAAVRELEAVDATRQRVRQEQHSARAAVRPAPTLLDALLEQRDREREQLRTARMVIKGGAIEPEVNAMGIFYWYVHPHMRDVGSRITVEYVQEIPPGSRSGVQLHQGGRLHYVLQGRGHTMIDGVRHDWRAGDEILLPIKFDGVLHQHFNDSPSEPAKLLCAEANWYDMLGADLGSGFDMLQACPEYRK
ncbi:MAG TPA: cupin domain-containing protein [Chloroflexota bacterium]|nr:cupin domain-containing protein [Chloroflexota bacterium]